MKPINLLKKLQVLFKLKSKEKTQNLETLKQKKNENS